MEDLAKVNLTSNNELFDSRFRGRNVLVTGHTGFKGSWLTQWLIRLGANVSGYALDPLTEQTLYAGLQLTSQLAQDYRADVRDARQLTVAAEVCQPDFVFHLAAQPLVRKSFEDPVATFATNIMGTVNVLETIKRIGRRCVVVVITTDKCYENREWLHAYRENDPMGGHDPYSASKGCTELVTASYRNSFFNEKSQISVATARAGNVIGGGDWAVDRIVPDIFRSIFANKKVRVRNRHATRPWQHVLEPLSGYLWLAACLDKPTLSVGPQQDIASAFNFGPELTSNRSVREVVEAFLNEVTGEWIDATEPGARHEASRLNLATDKAFHLLNWKPTWGFGEAVHRTAQWYQHVDKGRCPIEMTNGQISEFESAAKKKQQSWATHVRRDAAIEEDQR